MLSWKRLTEWGGCEDWEARLRGRFDDETAQRLRRATQSGTPLGSDEFTAAMEEHAGRRLRPGRPGRPRTRKVVAAAAGK